MGTTTRNDFANALSRNAELLEAIPGDAHGVKKLPGEEFAMGNGLELVHVYFSQWQFTYLDVFCTRRRPAKADALRIVDAAAVSAVRFSRPAAKRTARQEALVMPL